MSGEIELIAGFLVAFSMTFITIPWLIPKLKGKGVVGRDLNKSNRPLVAEMGGIAVVMGFFAGMGVLLALDGITDKELLYVSLSSILGAAFVGILDDMFELRQSIKAFFPLLLALPLGAAVDSALYLPFVGEVDFGYLMILGAPLAVTCAANAGNMLEGFNGLGTGLGIIMSITLTVLAFHHNRLDGVYILVPLIGCLLAFLWFNKYPARIFPGDTLMLFMGAAMAVAGMLSSLHVQTIVIFLPMIIEFGLKMKGHFKAENYCSGAANGHLEYHCRIESITHMIMTRWKPSESALVYAIWSLEFTVCLIVVIADFLVG